MIRPGASRPAIIALLALCLVPMTLYAQNGAPDKTIVGADGSVTAEYDTNHDGRIDLIVHLNSSGEKVSESMDYNHDGKMDVFYHYHNGVLSSEEVDTNYDGRIDLWIWLADGIYVTKYERDTNFDGKPDIVTVFGDKAKGGGTASR